MSWTNAQVRWVYQDGKKWTFGLPRYHYMKIWPKTGETTRILIFHNEGAEARAVWSLLYLDQTKSIEEVFRPISRGRFSTTSGHSLSTGCVRHRQFQLSDISPSSKYNPELRPNFNKDLLAWLRARAHTHTQTHTPHTQTHTHTHTHTHTEKLTLSQPDIQHFPFMCF